MKILALLVVLSLVIGLAGYFVLMIFFPEWVGITGKVARKNMKAHEGDKEDNGARGGSLEE